MPGPQNSLNSKLLIYTARLGVWRTNPMHPEPPLQKAWGPAPKQSNGIASQKLPTLETSVSSMGWGRHHQLHYRVGKCSSKPLIQVPNKERRHVYTLPPSKGSTVIKAEMSQTSPRGSSLCIAQELPGPPRSAPKAWTFLCVGQLRHSSDATHILSSLGWRNL